MANTLQHTRTRYPGLVNPNLFMSWWLSGGIAAANCVAAYQPKGAADLAASYVNLANPGTYNAAAAGGTPSWDGTNGWKHGPWYATTGIIPYDGWSAIVRVSNVNAVANAIFGVRGLPGDNNRFGLIQSDGDGIRQYHHGAAGDLIPGVMSDGVYAIVNHQGYVNGLADGAPTGAWGTNQTSYGMFIGAFNLAGSVSGNWGKYIQAFAIYNTPLSAAQVAALSAAMAAL